MPIYEFYCANNHRIYSFYARSLAYARRTPRCPDNSKYRLERLISNFAITGRAKEKAEPGEGGNLIDPRMEAAMAEMERDFGGMDAENPDPRLMARMMRKMSGLTGEKIPGEMEEVMRRMEAGENLEKLEEEYGDVMENFDPTGGGGDQPEGGAGGKLQSRWRSLRLPSRDPVLYEMSEFVNEPAPAAPAPKRPAGGSLG